MARVLTFSTKFPAYHPKKGQPTYFVEKIWKSLHSMDLLYNMTAYEGAYNDAFPLQFTKQENIHSHEPKNHTIRAGNRWKAGDIFSPRVWSGKPYNSPQIIIAPDIEVKKIWSFKMEPANFIDECKYFIDGRLITDVELFKTVCKNDGLNRLEFAHWFCGAALISDKRKPFSGQVICWNENINY